MKWNFVFIGTLQPKAWNSMGDCVLKMAIFAHFWYSTLISSNGFPIELFKAWNSIRTTSLHCRSDKKFLLTCKAKKKLKNVEQPESTLICKFGNRLNSLKMDSTSSPWLAKYLKLTPCWSKWSSLKEGQALAKLFKVAGKIVFLWVMSMYQFRLYKVDFVWNHVFVTASLPKIQCKIVCL